jgi:murein DD-endopeptidase MepM/ murein hydrolase activator NlpD
LRLDRRGPGDPRARERFRLAAARVLAVPVIALIIGQSLARRLALGRPALLTIVLLAGSLAVSSLSTAPVGARSSTAVMPIPDREFRAVQIPAPTVGTTRPVAPSIAPSVKVLLQTTPTPELPKVVRFRPRNGWVDISRFAAVSVRFSRPMDHRSTEAAFHVAAGGRPIPGTFRWAEGDTVLVLTPASPLPYGARITLSVDVRARAKDGAAIAEARSVAFTVRQRPAKIAHATSEPRPIRRSVGWRWPLLGTITQRFGESLTRYGFHYGIDIDGTTGDPVRAARSGRVVVAGSYDRCGGLEVHIDHGDGIASWYRHLSRIVVEKGASVEVGTLIGKVGDTGCSLGSHLHFAIRKGSRFVDPLEYLPHR